jgi:hypothetical protein
MSPPVAMGAVSAAARSFGSALVCGGALPLVAFVLHRVWPSMTYVAVVASAIAALCYLGSARASITHQGRRRLSLQTIAVAFPALLLARVAGHAISAHFECSIQASGAGEP